MIVWDELLEAGNGVYNASRLIVCGRTVGFIIIISSLPHTVSDSRGDTFLYMALIDSKQTNDIQIDVHRHLFQLPTQDGKINRHDHLCKSWVRPTWHSSCSACKTKNYCGPKCQTAHWSNHKEECPGHLRKVGMSNLEKARGLSRKKNWSQTLRHADLAATKLKQLKVRPIEIIDDALGMKYTALQFMDRHREALECAKELYLLYPTNHTHPPAIYASFSLIESCIHNKEYFDAALYARTLWETITMSRDSHIPDDLREQFTARGVMELSRALHHLAEHGGMPVEEKQGTGVEAIMLSRRALEICTQLYGDESERVAATIGILASALNYFNDCDDDEVPRLYEQAKSIYARVGSTSHVAGCYENLGNTYIKRAKIAVKSKDLDRAIANIEQALLRYKNASRIYRTINNVDWPMLLQDTSDKSRNFCNRP